MNSLSSLLSRARVVGSTVLLALVGTGLTLPGSAQAQGARIWMTNSPDYLRIGDRMDIRFSVADDSYVAVLHITPGGELDFLYPSSPYRSEYVRAGLTHSLTGLGSASRIVRSSDGIGYLYLVASPYPLDFSYFRGSGTGWYWGSAGRLVHGDPFLAFDQVARLIVPSWPSAAYLVDYYGYYVGGFHSYPAYACSDYRYGYGWGWTPSYGSCLRQDYFLSQYPNYYDTRRYAGDRRTLLRQYEHLYPDHRYKEPAGSSWVRQVPVRAAPAVDPRGSGFVPAGGARGQAIPAAAAGRGSTRPSDSREVVRPSGTVGGRERPTPANTGRSTVGSAPPPSSSGNAVGRARPTTNDRGGSSVGTTRAPTTNRAAGRVSGAPTTNRAAGRGAATSSPRPTTSRGRP